MTRLALSLAALCALAACSGSPVDEPAGAVTQTEREALDDAAEMLDERRLPDQEDSAEETPVADETGEAR